MKKDTGRRGGGRAAFIIIFLAVLTALALFLIRTDQVSVKGLHHIDEEDALNMLLPEEDRRLSSVLYRMIFGEKETPFFSSVKYSMEGLKKVSITVTEIPADAGIHSGRATAVVNRDGYVIGALLEDTDDLILLSGVDAQPVDLFLKLKTENEEALSEVLQLTRTVKESGLPCGMIVSSGDGYLLVFGDLTVNFGDISDKEEKLTALMDLYPSLIGLSGTLHLEDFRENDEKGKFYFEVPG